MSIVKGFRPEEGSKPGNIRPYFLRSSSETKTCKQNIKYWIKWYCLLYF